MTSSKRIQKTLYSLSFLRGGSQAMRWLEILPLPLQQYDTGNHIYSEILAIWMGSNGLLGWARVYGVLCFPLISAHFHDMICYLGKQEHASSLTNRIVVCSQYLSSHSLITSYLTFNSLSKHWRRQVKEDNSIAARSGMELVDYQYDGGASSEQAPAFASSDTGKRGVSCVTKLYFTDGLLSRSYSSQPGDLCSAQSRPIWKVSGLSYMLGDGMISGMRIGRSSLILSALRGSGWAMRWLSPNLLLWFNGLGMMSLVYLER